MVLQVEILCAPNSFFPKSDMISAQELSFRVGGYFFIFLSQDKPTVRLILYHKHIFWLADWVKQLSHTEMVYARNIHDFPLFLNVFQKQTIAQLLARENF